MYQIKYSITVVQ